MKKSCLLIFSVDYNGLIYLEIQKIATSVSLMKDTFTVTSKTIGTAKSYSITNLKSENEKMKIKGNKI